MSIRRAEQHSPVKVVDFEDGKLVTWNILVFAGCPDLTKGNYQVGQCYSLQRELIQNSETLDLFESHNDVHGHKSFIPTV
jgi:hypothetical protein